MLLVQFENPLLQGRFLVTNGIQQKIPQNRKRASCLPFRIPIIIPENSE